MKIKALEATMPRNAEAATFDDLKNSGVINSGFVLNEGDIIQFPESWDDAETCKQPVRDSGKFAHYIKVLVGTKATWMPVAAIRRQPVDFRETLKDYPVNLELMLLDSDYQRVEFMFGKTLKVTSVAKAMFPRFKDNTVETDAQGNILTHERNLPVFAIQ